MRNQQCLNLLKIVKNRLEQAESRQRPATKKKHKPPNQNNKDFK